MIATWRWPRVRPGTSLTQCRCCLRVLDGARLRHRLGEPLEVEQESVHAYVVGEHGDSLFPVWSSATVGAIGLEQFELPEGRSWPQVMDELAAATRRRGMGIHERKGFTSYGVAAAPDDVADLALVPM